MWRRNTNKRSELLMCELISNFLLMVLRFRVTWRWLSCVVNLLDRLQLTKDQSCWQPRRSSAFRISYQLNRRKGCSSVVLSLRESNHFVWKSSSFFSLLNPVRYCYLLQFFRSPSIVKWEKFDKVLLLLLMVWWWADQGWEGVFYQVCRAFWPIHLVVCHSKIFGPRNKQQLCELLSLKHVHVVFKDKIFWNHGNGRK